VALALWAWLPTASGLAPDRFGPIALQACCEIARRARLN